MRKELWSERRARCYKEPLINQIFSRLEEQKKYCKILLRARRVNFRVNSSCKKI
jgi:hypothetical protein